MQEYQERVATELSELNIKRDALRKFIQAKEFKDVDPDEQGRMISQQQIMGQYADILNKRIAAFA